MGVLDGRRLRFTRAYTPAKVWRVEAVTTGHARPLPLSVLLGYAVPRFRSTDTKIAGTRLRRPGKGATEWLAHVAPTLRPSSGGRYLGGHGLSYSPWKLVQHPWQAATWDTRQEACAALAAFYDEVAG